MNSVSKECQQERAGDKPFWNIARAQSPDADRLLALVHAERERAFGLAAIKDVDAHFEGRIEALGYVDAQARSVDQGLDLHLLVGDLLRAFEFGHAPGIEVTGPLALLRPVPARWMALALHELTTNAIKFGALGRSGARLAIGWRRQGGVLGLDWREHGVAILSPAGRRGIGFGQTLIEHWLPAELDARAQFALVPGGAHCTIALPLGHFAR